MKFARELDRELVPEWRVKYLDYKAGKKHIKGIARAVIRANGGTPGLGRQQSNLPFRTVSRGLFGANQTPASSDQEDGDGDARRDSSSSVGHGRPEVSQPKPIPVDERAGLTRTAETSSQYGSFVPTPPIDETRGFELPAPAMGLRSRTLDPGAQAARSMARPGLSRHFTQHPPSVHRDPSTSRDAARRTFSPRRRITEFFNGSPMARHPSGMDIRMQSFDEVRERERMFYEFLTDELGKIEGFYKQKEDQATKRLELLREQLHEMRNRRSEEVVDTKKRKEQNQQHNGNGKGAKANGKKGQVRGWIDPLKSKLLPIGPNSLALQQNMTQTTPSVPGPSANDDARRDYVRRRHDEVPYRTAKRKLKVALQEFYRGLELLKSYALLNRTAFRKLNKKYDKAVNARPPLWYMNEKVNKAWFVNSDVIDGHIRTVEDLYARYFERGNHKVAAGKLRDLTKRPADASGSAFRDGAFLGIGAVFGVQGLVSGLWLWHTEDPVQSTYTSYLLQIYAGYFLVVYLFGLFCLDCWIWTRNRVNYPFIFEFQPREHMDWKELAEFPCFFFLLLGLFMWFNFSQFSDVGSMYLYWPVLLVGLSLIVLCLPLPILHPKGRKWILYSHYRLLFAGLFPVEFRDFFLGDIWCSLTYATCNVELYFCLYATYWQNPVQCNSQHSRLMGFFLTLPPIWRALQCLRRYRDTQKVFPQLVNCGKYTMTILAGVFLTMYRLDDTDTYLALFIVFSTLNAIYCSIWDLFMDMSLVQPHSRHFLLRDLLAIKYRWPYYAIMVLDPILRFSWIFYAIFTYDLQHSTIVSFFVGFAEVTRRGMWTLFRVENEHCGNVALYKASRDVPLPYQIERFVERPSLDSAVEGLRDEEGQQLQQPPPSQQEQQLRERERWRRIASDVSRHVGGGDAAGEAEDGRTPSIPARPATPSLLDQSAARRRARAETLKRSRSIRYIMAEAHKQDFEKKRRPLDDGDDGRRATASINDDEDDEDDDEEEEEDEQEEEEAHEAAEAMDHHDGDGDGDRDRDSGEEDAEAVAEATSLLDDREDLREAEDLVARGRDDNELRR